jgi:hypothetical protein
MIAAIKSFDCIVFLYLVTNKTHIMKRNILCVMILMAGFISIKAQNRAPAGDDWKLTYDDAAGMLDRFYNCDILHPCHNNSNVVDLNNEVYKWIISKYTGIAAISLVDARYRNTDENRYKSLRGITDEGKSNVRGYKTKLVKVLFYSSTGNLSIAGTTVYYDCFTICPPPDLCLTSKE